MNTTGEPFSPGTRSAGNSWPFLAGSGEAARRMRELDWPASGFLPPGDWPDALRSTVRMMLTTPHPVVVLWGSEHRCLYNDGYCRALGLVRQPPTLGAPGADVWAGAWSDLQPRIHAVMQGLGPSWHEDEPLRLVRDGRLVDARWTYACSAIDDPAAPGGIGGVLLLCHESTSRHGEERFRRAVESTGLGTFDVDLGSGEARLSKGAWGAIGLPVSTHRPADELADRIHEADRPEAERVLARARAGVDDGDFRLRLRVVAAPNDVRHLQVSGRVGRDADGPDDAQHAVGIVWDTTEHQLMVEALQRADRLKDEFLATLAHELRNPLAALRSASYLMAREGVSPERQRWCSDVIQRQSKAMAMLLDDLMDVSRITRGKVELKLQRVRLQAVVDAALETARPSIESRRHALEIDLPPEPREIDADPLRLAQVLTHLLTNAARYTPEGGRLHLTARADGETLRLAVADDGIGIAAEAMPGLFEMFHRAGGSARGAGGLGVGLAVSRGLVRLHGGTIEARSDGPGRGTTFVIELPLRRGGAEDGEAAARAAAEEEIAPVLIADDNVDAAEALAASLRLDGHRVEVVSDGRRALEAARSRPPFAAFLDIGMPELDGYELAAEIRRQPWGKRLFLVAMTGWGQGADKDRARAAGFDLHLTKPLDPAEVGELLAKRRLAPST